VTTAEEAGEKKVKNPPKGLKAIIILFKSKANSTSCIPRSTWAQGGTQSRDTGEFGCRRMTRVHSQLLSKSSIASNLAKCISHFPNPASQTSELKVLTVIHEEIDINAKLPDILVEDCRTSSFEHHYTCRVENYRSYVELSYPTCGEDQRSRDQAIMTYATECAQ
jgi:hypothetical protein